MNSRENLLEKKYLMFFDKMVEAAKKNNIDYKNSSYMRFVGHRTVLLDDIINKAVFQTNIKQIVNLGCGLDTRPYRMNLPADLKFFEIDVPEIIKYKTHILDSMNAKPTCKLVRITMDLSKENDWVNQLMQAGFNKNELSLFLIEGVLIYLKQEVNHKNFNNFASLCCTGSKITGDYVTNEFVKNIWGHANASTGSFFGANYADNVMDIPKLLNEYGFEGTYHVYSETSPNHNLIIPATLETTAPNFCFNGTKV